MVALFDYCAFGKGGAAPSIDTSMHGLVEFDHVDHLHPDSIIALATSKDGKKLTVPAQDWVRDTKSMKALTHDWVFAGSRFVPDPLDKNKAPIYLANDGDVICVSNFESALLDLPIESSKQNAEVQFEAFTENIPPDGTKVAVCLEVIPPTTKKP
mgnify:CR=1 FL=1